MVVPRYTLYNNQQRNDKMFLIEYFFRFAMKKRLSLFCTSWFVWREKMARKTIIQSKFP